MSLSTITVQDGETTPVDHVFEHARVGTDFAQWDTPSTTEYIGREKLTLMLKRPSGPSNVANRNVKLVAKLEMPVMEVLSNDTVTGIQPAPTVAYRTVAELTLTLPDRCTQQQRKNLRFLLRDIMGGATFGDFVDDYKVPN